MSINVVGTVGLAYMPVVAPLPVRPTLSIDANSSQRFPPLTRTENLARMESLLAHQIQAGSLNQAQANTLSTFFASLATQTQMGRGSKELSSAEIIRKGLEAEEEGQEERGAVVGPETGPVRRKKSRAARAAAKPDPALNEALATFVKNLKDAQEKTAIYGASALSRSIASNEPVILDENA
ncbi:MAG: hypothetical protein RLZZ141_2132 [Pseudomonadota bacterium]|jgi:hypothetical protein